MKRQQGYITILELGILVSIMGILVATCFTGLDYAARDMAAQKPMTAVAERLSQWGYSEYEVRYIRAAAYNRKPPSICGDTTTWWRVVNVRVMDSDGPRHIELCQSLFSDKLADN